VLAAGRVRYRVCTVCEVQFATIETEARPEQLKPQLLKPGPTRAGHRRRDCGPLERLQWECKGCEFRRHCNRIALTLEALPCEKFQFLDERPAVLDRDVAYLLPVIDTGAVLKIIFE